MCDSTGGYVLGVSSGIATDRGLCPGGLCPPIIETLTDIIVCMGFLRILERKSWKMTVVTESHGIPPAGLEFFNRRINILVV